MALSVSSASRILLIASAAGLAGILSVSGTRTDAKPVTPPQKLLVPVDRLAWQQFTLAVTPSGVPGKVAYETWASDQDIYVNNPCPPGGGGAGCNTPVWPDANAVRPKPFQRSLLGQSHLGLARGGQPLTVQAIGPDQGCGTPPGIGPGNAAANSGFPAQGCVGEEVRRDRASFNYLVQNGLWSKAGLRTFYNSKRAVAFPTNALEVKADWIPVATLASWLGRPQAFILSNFYTASAQATPNGPSTVYAMTSMHVSVKAPGFPNWVWANFENAYTPGRCDQTGCVDRFGAALPSVPAKPVAWQQYGACQKTPAAQAMMRGAGVAPVFSNYCLTGAQTAYGTKANPTLLGSPIVEPLNANVPMAASSCISCHAGASFKGDVVANVGAPVGPNAPAPGYAGYDFMWGLLAAQ